MIPDLYLDTNDEYDTMDMGLEVASLRIDKELQRHYDVEGEDVALSLGVGITIGGLTQLRQRAESFGGEAFETVPEDGSSIRRRTLPCRGASIAGSSSKCRSTRHVETTPILELVEPHAYTLRKKLLGIS